MAETKKTQGQNAGSSSVKEATIISKTDPDLSLIHI